MAYLVELFFHLFWLSALACFILLLAGAVPQAIAAALVTAFSIAMLKAAAR